MRHTSVTALLLALPLALFAAGCGGHAEHDDHAGHDHGPGGHGEAEAAGFTCPPCGMKMPADFELVEVGGMKFAICNDACREKVTADPAKYAMYAAP